METLARPDGLTPLVDCHTHTRHSDGRDTLEANLSSAECSHVQLVALTDHLTLPDCMDPAGEVQVIEADLAAHAADVEDARRRHPDVELVYGWECDWYEGCEDNVERWSASATFRLGSVHWLGPVDPVDKSMPHGWIDDPDDLHLWEQLGPDEVWRLYADHWCRACESPLAFDSMAHPDLAMRFCNEGFAPTIDLTPLWDQMASCAHDCKRRIEVSTAGLRKSVGGYYPAPGLLARFWRAGVPVTIGSDAHRDCDVGWGIREAYAYVAATGYRSIDVPRADGSWSTLSL